MRTSKVEYSFLVGVIVFLFLLNGCGHYDVFKNSVQDSSTKSSSRLYEYNPANKAKKEAEIYFEYLKEKDIQSLNKLFSLEVQNNHNLEKEWATFFEAIDGNIVSYKKISIHGEEMNVDDRIVTFSALTIRFEDVQTDTGKTYELIDYREIRVDANHSKAEGINLFSVLLPYEDDMVNKEVAVGEIFDK